VVTTAKCDVDLVCTVPNPNQLIVPADPAAHQSASAAYQVAAMAQINKQKQLRSVPWNKEQMQSH
jgi:hypothetical protein